MNIIKAIVHVDMLKTPYQQECTQVFGAHKLPPSRG